MAEPTSEPTATRRVLAGWMKTCLTSLAGLLSGAVLMYASPLVDMIIKPAKPIANFQTQASGLIATLQNKSSNGHEGWWDFGDGSALEPFVAAQPTVTHSYAKPGSYTVKLSLKNIVGDENERSVTLIVDAGGSALPSIDAFEVVPVQGDYAPATYRVATTVRNAEMCVWSVGNKPLEFSPETGSGHQERLVTFKDAGPHVVKLAAYGDKQAIEKTATILVKKAPLGLVTATVAITYEAVQILNKVTNPTLQLHFPTEQKGDTAIVNQAIAADLGFEIVKARLEQAVKNPNIQSTKVEIDPAKRDKVLVTCELVRPTVRKSGPAFTVQLALTQQRQSGPTTKTVDPVSMNLTAPGSTLIPLPSLPAGWTARSRKLTLTLEQDSKHFGWKEGELPQHAAIQLTSSSAFDVSAVEDGDTLRIDVAEIKKASSIIGN